MRDSTVCFSCESVWLCNGSRKLQKYTEEYSLVILNDLNLDFKKLVLRSHSIGINTCTRCVASFYVKLTISVQVFAFLKNQHVEQSQIEIFLM